MAKTKWTMPAWMEPHRDRINNTGGNSVEDLMNSDPEEANVVINAPLAVLCVAVEAQVQLLNRLHKDGVI